MKETADSRSLYRIEEPEYDEVDSSCVRQVVPRRENMYVQLFGGLSVYVDGKRLRDEKWTKKKSKLLFAHLVLRFGRTLSRDALISYLWPQSLDRRAVDNLYVNWAAVKRAVTPRGDTRPFVINSGMLYSINSDLVTSDVEEFDALARRMLFGEVGVQEVREICLEMDRLYIDDLLSGIKCDPQLESMRKRYRDTYIDVLVMAAEIMLAAGDVMASLWFARKALSLETRREDVYQTLMRSQGMSGQRTAVMQTFSDCKRNLLLELGVKPSKKTIDLYNQLMRENFK